MEDKYNIEGKQYTIDDIERLRIKYKTFQTISTVLIFVGMILVFSLFTSIVFFAVSGYLYNESRKLKLIIKIWAIENKVKLPNLSEVKYIQTQNRKNLSSVHFIEQITKENLKFTLVEIDDVVSFKYKNKEVELIEFKEKKKKNKQPQTYLCLITKNPDKIDGKTVAWSDKRWNFNFPEKIKTESIVFDKIFKSESTGQRDARMHLKTNVMQDMIDLNESLATKDSVFYFDESTIYIIFRYIGDALEPSLDKPITQEASTDDYIMKDISLGLKIFDDFWLNRKTLSSQIVDDNDSIKIELGDKMLGVSAPQNNEIKKKVAFSLMKIPAIGLALFLILMTLLISYFGSRSLIAYTTFSHSEGIITGFKSENKVCEDDPDAKILIETSSKNNNKKASYKSCTFSRVIQYGDNKTYTTPDSTSKNIAGNVGDKISILVNPNNDNEIYVNDFTLWIPVVIMLVLLIFTAFVLKHISNIFGFVKSL